MPGRMSELTLDVNTATVTEWDMPVFNPFDPAPPILLFTAADIALALQQHTPTRWPSGDTLEVTPDGYATVTRRGDRPMVYELFPARFNDENPYTPTVYVGRWPD